MNDTATRNQILIDNLSCLPRAVSRLMTRNPGMDEDAAYDIAEHALLKAAEHYDPKSGYYFSSYFDTWLYSGLYADKKRRERLPQEPPLSVEDLVAAESFGFAVRELPPETDPELDRVEAYIPLGDLLAQLSDREAQILRMRFFDGLTYEQCGRAFMVTRERIRQIEAKALRKLRRYFLGQSLEDFL